MIVSPQPVYLNAKEGIMTGHDGDRIALQYIKACKLLNV